MLTDRDRVRRAAFVVDGYVDLLAEGDELLDGGRALHVGGHEQGAVALLLEEGGQLGGSGRLAGALEAGHHDDRRRGARGGEVLLRAAEDGGELFLNDVDDGLGRRHAFEGAWFEGARLHLGDELADDLEVDVGFEQRDAHLAQRLVDILLAEPPAPSQLLKDAAKFV